MLRTLASPLQVEIIDHTNWLALWLPFATALLVAVVAYAGVVKSNNTNRYAVEAADARSKTELQAKRADQFRDEVASILAERLSVTKAQRNAGFALRDFRKTDPEDREEANRFFKTRGESIEVFNKFEQLVIRASLFTNDAEAIAALNKLRDISEESKYLFTLPSKKDPVDEASEFAAQTEAAFKDLETVTRKLSTALPGPNPIGAKTSSRHWYCLWLR